MGLKILTVIIPFLASRTNLKVPQTSYQISIYFSIYLAFFIQFSFLKPLLRN